MTDEVLLLLLLFARPDLKVGEDISCLFRPNARIRQHRLWRFSRSWAVSPAMRQGRRRRLWRSAGTADAGLLARAAESAKLLTNIYRCINIAMLRTWDELLQPLARGLRQLANLCLFTHDVLDSQTDRMMGRRRWRWNWFSLSVRLSLAI